MEAEKVFGTVFGARAKKPGTGTLLSLFTPWAMNNPPPPKMPPVDPLRAAASGGPPVAHGEGLHRRTAPP